MLLTARHQLRRVSSATGAERRRPGFGAAFELLARLEAQKLHHLLRALRQKTFQSGELLAIAANDRELGRDRQRHGKVGAVCQRRAGRRPGSAGRRPGSRSAAHLCSYTRALTAVSCGTPAGPAGDRLQVIDDAARAVADLSAALTEAQAEVDVLVAVVERGVEAAELLEVVATDEQAGGGRGGHVA